MTPEGNSTIQRGPNLDDDEKIMVLMLRMMMIMMNVMMMMKMTMIMTNATIIMTMVVVLRILRMIEMIIISDEEDIDNNDLNDGDVIEMWRKMRR